MNVDPDDPQEPARSGDPRELTQATKDIIQEFFKGHPVLDKQAFEKKTGELWCQDDRDLLQALRDAVFDHDDE